MTRTSTLPALTTSAASTPIVTRVAEPKITVRAWPPTVALRPLTKPAPVTARLKPELPEATGLGAMLFSVGLWAGAGGGGEGAGGGDGDCDGGATDCPYRNSQMPSRPMPTSQFFTGSKVSPFI